jgi:uncharacterized protein (TIGR02001 family)
MRKSLLSLAVLSTLAMPALSFADEAAPAVAPAAEAAPVNTVAYNVGLYSQYIFRGLTQSGNKPAIQGGVDYTNVSGFYLGTWASNVSWLGDSNSYSNASLELDLYGGYRGAIKDVSYDVGLLQYVYPGDFKSTGFLLKRAETTEVYGSLAYKWVTAKLSVAVSDGVFGNKDAAGTYYADITANYPVTDTITATAHVGRQEYSGSGNDVYSYTDWKLGLSKAFANGVTVGAYYTDTNAKELGYGKQPLGSTYPYAYNGGNIADAQGTIYVQKTF